MYRIRISAAGDSTVWDQGDSTFSIGPILPVNDTPAEFVVSPPYPNPFNPSTALTVQIPKMTNVRIVMYNILGQEIRVLHDGMMSAGSDTLVWDGRNDSGTMAASGVYFYTVKAGTNTAKGKVMFLR